MAKPELGTKRVCLSCSAKYYDLLRDPIVCPKCGAVFELEPREKAALEARDREVESEQAAPEAAAATAGAEVISLSDVAEEETDDEDGEDAKEDGGEDIPDIPDVDVDVELDDEDADADTFLDDDEEEDGGDVSGILGDVPGEDEDT